MDILITALVILAIVIWAVAKSGNTSIRAEQNAQLVSPHCQTKGSVTTCHVKLKKGISGAKATVALLTAGVSVPATGLSRREAATEAKCSNCGSIWHF
jgi:hypothetical protein